MNKATYTIFEFDSDNRYIGDYEIQKPDYDKLFQFKSKYQDCYRIEIHRKLNNNHSVLDILFR